MLIYDQTCAAEKRRRRKRGQFPDPDKRVVINELVCEGCGDCGVKSNCVSVQPLETEFGRKRTIDQSSCNKDFSCVKGFCPSFVTVEGAKLKRGAGVGAAGRRLLRCPSRRCRRSARPTASSSPASAAPASSPSARILGMAAHLEGKGVGIIDMAGLAQKGGAVHSHIRIAERPEDIHAIRVAARGADLVLGGDIVVAGTKKVLGGGQARHHARGRQSRRGAARRFHPQSRFLAADRAAQARASRRRRRRAARISSTPRALATALLGQSIGANMFMLGYAYQLGALPLSAQAIEQAIELNGEAVAMNLAAFRWGRRAAARPGGASSNC